MDLVGLEPTASSVRLRLCTKKRGFRIAHTTSKLGYLALIPVLEILILVNQFKMKILMILKSRFFDKIV